MPDGVVLVQPLTQIQKRKKNWGGGTTKVRRVEKKSISHQFPLLPPEIHYPIFGVPRKRF